MTAIVQTVINGRSYRLVRLQPLAAGRLATRVAQALAGALSDAEVITPLVDAFKAKGDKAGAISEKIADMMADAPRLLSAMAGGIRKIDGDALYSAAAECVVGNLFAPEKLGDEGATNRHFSEYPADLLPVMVWALKENCAGFFGIGAQASK